MRARLNDLLLLLAASVALLVACAESYLVAAGIAAGLVAGALFSKLLIIRVGRGRAYGLATLAWLASSIVAAATSSPIVAGASASMLATSLAIIRLLKDSSTGGALYTFILTYFACECLAEASAIGYAGKYLPYMLNATLSSWVVPSPLVRLAFTAGLTYLLVKYFIRQVSGRARVAVVTVVFGGVWALLTVASVSSVVREDSYPLAVVMSLTPLILYSILLNVARR